MPWWSAPSSTAAPEEVWADVRDIESHVTWMQDAAAIRFLTDHREGAGTRFECDTKVGPFSLTDVMEITSWEDEPPDGCAPRRARSKARVSSR